MGRASKLALSADFMSRPSPSPSPSSSPSPSPSRLPTGSVCYTDDGEACELLSFEGSSWTVRLSSGREAPLPEASLRFGHSLLIDSLDTLVKHVALRGQEQGACGRGLISTEPVEKGTTLFEEAPLFVVATTAGEGGSVEEYRAHHTERWHAYTTLLARRDAEAEPGGKWHRAYASFDDLGVADEVPDHVKDAAGCIAASSGAAPSTTEDQVVAVLMRFHCNQFGRLNPGAPSDDEARLEDATTEETAVAGAPPPAPTATALFPFTSRINHSCDPTIGMALRKAYQRARGSAEYMLDDGDVHLAYALRHLLPFERLTFNYGPEELLGWNVTRRRAYLFERLGFVCGCERCVEEERAVALMRSVEKAMDGALVEMKAEAGRSDD